MTISYPRALPEFFFLGDVSLRLARNDITVRDGLGHLAGGSLGTDLWTWSVEVIAQTDDESLEVEAWFDSLDGSAQRFLAVDPRRWAPRAYMDSGLGGLTTSTTSFDISSDGRDVTLHGMDEGTIFAAGDMLGWKGGSGLLLRHATRIVSGGTVDGSGDVTLSVRPAVWPVVQGWAGLTAHIDTPSITMRLLWPETQIGDTSPEGFMTARIVAMQDLPEDDS